MKRLLNRQGVWIQPLVCAIVLMGLGNWAEPGQQAGDNEQKHITKVLAKQVYCWNREDIDGFMETYWKSDDLTFSSGGKTIRGWQATLDRYKKSYPAGAMGKLHFEGLEVDLLSSQVALVLGRWYLDDKGQKKEGNFSLVFKKIDGDWKIVHDHSSSLDKEE